MRLSLRGGEKLYLNGAVVSVDRKVSIELLNDVTFLLEAHILQAADATTPLRQLYFVVQLMLMEPATAAHTRVACSAMLAAEQATFDDSAILAGLKAVDICIEAERPFDALRLLRGMFAREDAILRATSHSPPCAA